MYRIHTCLQLYCSTEISSISKRPSFLSDHNIFERLTITKVMKKEKKCSTKICKQNSKIRNNGCYLKTKKRYWVSRTAYYSDTG